MRPIFNKYFVYVWYLIILIAVIWEGIAWGAELSGNPTLPTLSRIIVATIPQPWLTIVTVAIAAWLVFHWFDVRNKEPKE